MLAVFTFGRFNPPTKGHAQIFKKMAQIAHSRNGGAFVFASCVEDTKRNPIPFYEKIMWLDKLFPSTLFDGKKIVKNPFQAVVQLQDSGYDEIIMVVGSDRVEEFRKRFSSSYDRFKNIQVIGVGDRTIEDGVDGMSSTKARLAAQHNDLAAFEEATGWPHDLARDLMCATRKGMGLENNGRTTT